MEFLSRYWEAIIAISALLVSVASVVIAYRSQVIQRDYYKASVRPLLHFGQWDYENCIKVDLRNLGIGPAFVKEIEVYKNKHEKRTCIYDWLPKKLPGTMNYKEYWTGFENFAVKLNGEIQLIEIPVDTDIPEEVECREQIRGILRDLTIKITYDDFYNNHIEEKELKLSLFGRVDNEN